MTRQFKSLKEIEEYMTSKKVRNLVFRDEGIRQVLAHEMSEAVKDVVYANYTPKKYERRGDENGGLSAQENMHVTNVEIFIGDIVVFFENLTMGQRHKKPIYDERIDSLDGQFITDTIVEGIENNWYYPEETDKFGRVPSDPRDFITETINNIKANPAPLIKAIKRAYKKVGFDIK